MAGSRRFFACMSVWVAQRVAFGRSTPRHALRAGLVLLHRSVLAYIPIQAVAPLFSRRRRGSGASSSQVRLSPHHVASATAITRSSCWPALVRARYVDFRTIAGAFLHPCFTFLSCNPRTSLLGAQNHSLRCIRCHSSGDPAARSDPGMPLMPPRLLLGKEMQKSCSFFVSRLSHF